MENKNLESPPPIIFNLKSRNPTNKKDKGYKKSDHVNEYVGNNINTITAIAILIKDHIFGIFLFVTSM
jgi:hypothetical protein